MAKPAQYQNTHCSEFRNNNINQLGKELFACEQGKKEFNGGSYG
jgi:ribosomal protein L37AE/L43A